MPYTEAVTNEVHRIASLAPLGVPRKVIADVQVGKYVIPKVKDLYIFFMLNFSFQKNR